MAQTSLSSPAGYQACPTEQLAHILNTIQDAVVAFSLPDRRLIYKSAAFEKVFGCDAQAYVADPNFFKQIVHPADLDLTAAAQAAALRDGCVEIDHRVIFANGEVRWLHRRVRILFDAKQRPVQVIDAAHDITAGKRARQDLEAVNRKQHAILANLPDLMFHLRADGTILDFHGQLGDVIMPLEQLLGRNVRDFVDFPTIPAELVKQADAAIWQTALLGQPTTFEYTMPDGHQFEARIVPLAAADELIIIARDVTERKQQEAALRRSEAALQEANLLLEQRIAERTVELQQERSLLRTVIDAIPDLIYIKDPDHRMVLNNLAHTRFVGRTMPPELVGKTDLDFFPPSLASQFHAAEDRVFAMGQAVVDLEEPSLRPDGTAAWMLTTKMPLYNAEGELTGLVGITRDITARKAAEAAVAAALAREKELGELKSRFVSMASHEFRTPLAAILATTEILMLVWEQLDKAKIYDRLDRIRTQVLRLTEIMEDVLQLTRIQTGGGKFDPALGDLHELCAGVVRDLAELPGNRDRICYTCSRPPLLAVFDARLLRQAIGNLLHNALKYSAPGTTVDITLAQAPTGEFTLRITDAGIGIPAADLPHLFEPFHRAANVGAIQGTGMGLAITKEAIERHGGAIAVQSRVGEGTTFTVTLPA